jgi:GAF domain-containing protein
VNDKAQNENTDEPSRVSRGWPGAWACYRFAVRDRADFVVEYARTHERVKDDPRVTEDGLRRYAGIPLMTSRGHTGCESVAELVGEIRGKT